MRPPEEVKKEIVRQWLAKAAESLLSQEHQLLFLTTHAIEQLRDLVKDAEPETTSSLRAAVALTQYVVDI